MATLLPTAADFDERLAVEDGQLATWQVREKEGAERAWSDGKRRRDRAESTDQSWHLGALA